MILFLILLSVLNGYILHAQPVPAVFFIIISSLICHRRMEGKAFLLFHLGTTAIVAMAVFILPETDSPAMVDNVTVTGYKYYRDGVAHTVAHEDGRYDLYMEEAVELPVGAVCQGPFEVVVPEVQRNFIKKDDRVRMKVNGLDGRIYADSVDSSQCAAGPMTWGMQLAEMRDGYMEAVLGSTVHDYKFDILTLSVGNKSYITSELFDKLQKLGIYHLYVISGTHVAFITAILFHVLNRFRLDITLIKLLMIAALLVFLCLNFFSPSVFRAVFMTVTLLLVSFTRKKPYLSVISLSALVQIVINPWIVLHAGFQLSYITTFMIILSRHYWSGSGFFLQLLGITLIAEISTLVILLHQFNELSISGIAMNMIFVPIFTSVIFPMVILFNIMVFTHLPEVVDAGYAFVFGTLKDVITLIADGMDHRTSVGSLGPFWLILLSTLSYWMIRTLCLRQVRRFLMLSACFILSIFLIDRIPHDDFTVTMVDVGQGDAFVIEDHRNRSVLLIDTGGRYYYRDAGQMLSDQTVLPYLKEAGIDRIDMMVLSHFDLDHVGEAHHIIGKMSVDHIYVNPNDPGFQVWHEEMPDDFRGTVVDALQTRELQVGDIAIRRLFPGPAHSDDDPNRNSLVLEVDTGSYSFLFTGDTDEEMEQLWVGEAGRIEADVLKLAHHGSDTSTGEYFIANSDFTYGLISAGAGNRYGHPHREVLERAGGMAILDTSKHGMVRFRIDGREMCIETKLDPSLNHCIKKRAE
ncbi:DNA internalization-related competence protein ComEC/Rec2 [Salinicoccus roseus]|uniref:DNA internalization-related competence protein ComEC/Rec2 n=1 Tax=Salinicoccus roseus TaxID=45670 RepID=UPI002301D93E|nr:DNA internalization-related competence protein ComEC/Rec2 [Salinicoccus roseus]